MKRIVIMISLCIILCLTGCQRKSENYIEPLKSEHITKKDSVQYLPKDCIGYIEEIIPYTIEWYNMIDKSQKDYINTYAITKEKEEIIIPQGLYNPKKISDLSIKIVESVDLTKIDKKSLEKSLTIAENIMPASQPIITLATMTLTDEAQLTILIDLSDSSKKDKTKCYYTISKDSWLEIRNQILEAKSYYYNE